MRNAGIILLCGGILGFFYCTGQLSGLAPPPAGASFGEYMGTTLGRWELARYACAAGAALGLLLAMFPKGR